MITEQYVSFDTAKMLKKAGFTDVVYCPTQALAARWLREVHNIHVSGVLIDDLGKNKEPDWFYTIDQVSPYEQYVPVSECNSFQSYEAAIEAGLQDVLRKIIKNKEK